MPLLWGSALMPVGYAGLGADGWKKVGVLYNGQERETPWDSSTMRFLIAAPGRALPGYEPVPGS